MSGGNITMKMPGKIKSKKILLRGERELRFYYFSFIAMHQIKRKLNCSISEQGCKKRTSRGIKLNKWHGSSQIAVQGRSINVQMFTLLLQLTLNGGTNATLKCKVVVQMQLRALQLVQIWYTAFKTTKTNFTFPKMGRFSPHLVFSLL